MDISTRTSTYQPSRWHGNHYAYHVICTADIGRKFNKIIAWPTQYDKVVDREEYLIGALKQV